MIEIKGSGGLFGGGGQTSSNSAQPDEQVGLRSRAIIKVLFLLSEGEIAGFPPGEDYRKSIYVNNTPIMNPDSTLNFQGVTVDYRPGTQFQSSIPAAAQGAASPENVGVKISNSGGPVTRTITNPNANSVKVTLTTPGLSRTDNNRIVGSRVNFDFYLSTANGPFVYQFSDSFAGRSQGGYARDYKIGFANNGAPWQVRIVRTTPDVPIGDVNEQNDLYWQTITPIIERRFKHPNSALLYLEFDSKLFKSQPVVTMKLKGIICQIPSNYNPITRVNTGVWDGTFTRAWTNNPAWILMNMLTNPRYGAGNYITQENVDKWSLYAIAQYCDGLVNNGYGGTEPRFVYNNYINSKAEIFQAVNALLAQVRGLAYTAGGQILFSQDRPGTQPVDVYTDANTICEYSDDGVLTQPNFTYDYVSLKEKHSKCHVYWYDQKENGKKKPTYIDLFDIGYGSDMTRYGDEVKEVVLEGCTSEAEARRHGRWLLLTERENSKTVAFATGDDAIYRYPGDLILVADSSESVVRLAGRIVSSTTTSVTLDAPVTIGSANQSSLVLMINGVRTVRTVTNAPGVHTTLLVLTPLPADIPVGTLWALNDPTTIETYKIISISNPEAGKYGIMGVLYSDKFDAIDSNETLVAVENFRQAPEPPEQLLVTAFIGGYQIGWSPSTSLAVTKYELEFQEVSAGTWQPSSLAEGVTDAQVLTAPGQYKFRVRAINLYGKVSSWQVSSFF
jgi:predicted phage tail protein